MYQYLVVAVVFPVWVTVRLCLGLLVALGFRIASYLV